MNPLHRRTILRSATFAAASIALPKSAEANPQPTTGKLRLGLVGCGGRGTGAAAQALAADPDVTLTAIGDAFPEAIPRALNHLNHPDLSQENRFVGLDAFQKVIDSGIDVIILATPPGFRPEHLRAAVEKGIHVFLEKPVAVDVPGLLSVEESCRIAKKKGLSLVSGFCWRYDTARREAFTRLHDGQIGKLQSVYATYYTGPVKPMPPATARPAGMPDAEWQLRNWMNFSYLSGDSLVEQAVHSVDKICWATGDIAPISAVGVGGRNVDNHEGNIFDHFQIVYEFPGGIRATMGSRQQTGCYNENADFLTGTTGELTIGKGPSPKITGKNQWRFRGEHNSMYQAEHDHLFQAIRSGKTVTDAPWMINSTAVAILGRTAAYTGKKITWEDFMKTGTALTPGPMPIPGQPA